MSKCYNAERCTYRLQAIVGKLEPLDQAGVLVLNLMVAQTSVAYSIHLTACTSHSSHNEVVWTGTRDDTHLDARVSTNDVEGHPRVGVVAVRGHGDGGWTSIP